jgi:hypothetical protein
LQIIIKNMLATLNPSRIHQAFIISVGRVGEAQPRKAWKFKSLNDLTKACDQRAALISESLGEPRYATRAEERRVVVLNPRTA